MATRLYLTNSTAPYTPLTPSRGGWDQVTGAVTKLLGAAPGGTNTTVAASETSATNLFDVLLGRWVSAPAVAAGNLAGVVSWVFGVKQGTATTPHFRTHVHIFVTVGDTDVVRGTVLTDSIGAADWTTTATAATATPTVCQLAIFSEDGSGNLTQIAIITNDTTLWAGGSVGYTRSWVTPWSKVAGVRYALGLLVVSAVTLPTLYGLSFPNAAILGTILATAPRAYAAVPSQATMPSSVLASSFAGSGAPRMTYAELT
jgi:hypothetical protein